MRAPFAFSSGCLRAHQRARLARWLVAVVWLVTALFAAAAATEPPSLARSPALAGTFDVTRALEHVRRLSAYPGQTGSAGNAERRRYIAERLRELALEVETQSTDAAVTIFGRDVAARVHNVIGRIRGTEGAPAVMLAAHYDAVPNGPGAADDASGAATLLETARVLRSGAAPRRDIVFLFTDGEELGLLGADAFTSEHPLWHDIAVVLNFEARGSRGTSALYETSRPNGWLISEFARAVPHPATNSLLSSLSRALPNDTDFTIFKRGGAQGYAFAFADGLGDYHRATDTPARLDPRSLAHHGSYALALAAELAQRQRLTGSAREVVYFDLFRRSVVVYPATFARLGGVLIALFAVFIVARRRRADALRVPGVAVGALACLGCLALSIAASVAVDAACGLVLERGRRMLWAGALLPVHIALGLAACLLLYRQCLKRWTPEELYLGSLLVGALLSLGLGLGLPGTSYAPQWLTAAALCGEWVRLRSRAGRAGVGLAWVGLALVPAAYFVGALGAAFFVLIGTMLPAATAVATGWGASLFLPWTAGRWSAHARPLLLSLTGFALALGAGCSAWGRLSAPPPTTLDLNYVFDADTGRAGWMWHGELGREPAATELTAQGATSMDDPLGEGHRLAAAPPLGFDAPILRVVADRREPGRRELTLDLTARGEARCVDVLGLAGTRVLSARINGKSPHPIVRFSAETDRRLWKLVTGATLAPGWNLHYCGLNGAPLHLELVTTDARARFRVIDASDGLPAPARSFAARLPPFEFGVNGNRTLVTREFQL